jgi:hypothetical protein
MEKPTPLVVCISPRIKKLIENKNPSRFWRVQLEIQENLQRKVRQVGLRHYQ